MEGMQEDFYDEEKALKQFKRELKQLKNSMSFNYRDVAVPDFLGGYPTYQQGDALKLTSYLIKGLDDEYFKDLNDTICFGVDGNSILCNVYYPTGDVQTVVDRKANTGHIIVASEVGLDLPYEYSKNKDKIEYLDYYEDEESGVLLYFYSISKDYLYRENRVMAVLGTRKFGKYYSGVRLMTTHGYTLYIFIVPYSEKVNMDTRVIMVGNNCLDPNVMQEYIGFLTQGGFIVDPNVFSGEFFEVLYGFDYERFEQLSVSKRDLEETAFEDSFNKLYDEDEKDDLFDDVV